MCSAGISEYFSLIPLPISCFMPDCYPNLWHLQEIQPLLLSALLSLGPALVGLCLPVCLLSWLRPLTVSWFINLSHFPWIFEQFHLYVKEWPGYFSNIHLYCFTEESHSMHLIQHPSSVVRALIRESLSQNPSSAHCNVT